MRFFALFLFAQFDMGMCRVDVYSAGILCMDIESLGVAVVSLHKT
jgi:hypothetical protein